MKYLAPDKGPWEAEYAGEQVFLLSDEFTHDVKIEISGDFRTTKNKLDYAKALANWMNERLSNEQSKCPCRDCEEERKDKHE